MARPETKYQEGPLVQGDNIPDQEWYEQSATQKYMIGTRLVLSDGRVFRYTKNGAAALAPGDLAQSAAEGGTTTYQHDLTPSAAALGATSVSFTTVTDAITANEFTDGFLAVTAGPGLGDMYKIVSHAGGAAGALVFVVDRPLLTAWTTSSRITIIKDVCMDVVEAATTPTGVAVGVAPIVVSIGYYCWLQTWGIANVLVKTALTAGTNVIRDAAAAASVGIDNGVLVSEQVGFTGWVADTTDTGFVFLKISP